MALTIYVLASSLWFFPMIPGLRLSLISITRPDPDTTYAYWGCLVPRAMTAFGALLLTEVVGWVLTAWPYADVPIGRPLWSSCLGRHQSRQWDSTLGTLGSCGLKDWILLKTGWTRYWTGEETFQGGWRTQPLQNSSVGLDNRNST